MNHPDPPFLNKDYNPLSTSNTMKNCAKAFIAITFIAIGGIHFVDNQEFTPDLLKEFDQKSQKWPHIRHLYKEGFCDSVMTNKDQIVIHFHDPHSIGDPYFVWGKSKKPLKGLDGLFWVSYSSSKMYTDIKEASDITLSERALVLVPLLKSPVISSVYVEGPPVQPIKTHGDLWFTTWADNDTVYCSWGDGTGIGEGPFTDMGIGCLTGTFPAITGVTQYRDPHKKDDLSQNNKPSSLLFFNNSLYAHVHSPLGDPTVGFLACSNDYGITWEKAKESPWTREVDSNFRCLFFINMGKNYELNTDGYVYALGIGKEWSWEKGIYLARVAKEGIMDYTSYEYLVSVSSEDGPVWSTSQFDANPLPGLYTRSQASAMYHPGVNRFLLLTAKDVFDAPNPWGPWTYAGSWARPPPKGWINGYQPGIISKDTEKDSFWFTIAGQPKNPQDTAEVNYCLNLGKIVMNYEPDTEQVLVIVIVIGVVLAAFVYRLKSKSA